MKVLTVCGLGQGTSLILKMNVESVLQSMGISGADVENTDVSSASSMNADFIITSQELSETLAGHSSTIIVVNNYFDEEEIKKALEPHVS